MSRPTFPPYNVADLAPGARRSAPAAKRNVGPIGDVLAGRGRITTGFFGVVGVSTMHGLMEMSAEEAQTKRLLADACERVIGMFESGKIGGFGLHSFAAVPAITAMYTDNQAPPGWLTEWETLGVPVHLVSTEAEETDYAVPRRLSNAARR